MNEIEPKVTHVEMSVNGGEFRAISPEELARLGVESAPVRKHWAAVERTKPPTPPEPILAGRNESCPCGSGKKYKKCCRK